MGKYKNFIDPHVAANGDAVTDTKTVFAFEGKNTFMITYSAVGKKYVAISLTSSERYAGETQVKSRFPDVFPVEG